MVRFTNAVASGLLAAVLVLATISVAFWGFVLMGLRDLLCGCETGAPPA